MVHPYFQSRFTMSGGVLLALSLMVTAACTSKSAGPPPTPIERGKMVYNTNCIACHNPDPHLDGAVGPALQGASLELLQARVMSASYPKDYKPKRSTHIMAALPYLKGEIPALHAYLSNL